MSYETILQELRAKQINPLYGQFYEFAGFPLEEVFEAFFAFGQEFLDNPHPNFEIRPAKMYFSTMTTVNAVAYETKGINLIEIFKGMIFLMHRHFLEKEDIFNQPGLLSYKEAILTKEPTVGMFLFRFITLYIMYHETGHLIQRSPAAPAYPEELTGILSAADIRERHTREHDADWFSAGQITFHLMAFANTGDEENKKIDPKTLARITSIALAGIYAYFIFQSNGISAIYYAEGSHPHPAIRFSYTVIYMLDTLSANFDQHLDKTEVLTEAIRIVERMLQTPDKNIVETYSRHIFEHLNPIEEYINKIRKDTEGYPDAVINKLVPTQKVTLYGLTR